MKIAVMPVRLNRQADFPGAGCGLARATKWAQFHIAGKLTVFRGVQE